MAGKSVGPLSQRQPGPGWSISRAQRSGPQSSAVSRRRDFFFIDRNCMRGRSDTGPRFTGFSQCDDDLADLLVGLEVLVCLDSVGEGKGFGNFDLEAAVGDAVEDIFAGGAGEVVVGVDFAHGIGAHGELLMHGNDEREGGGLERERAILDEYAVVGGGGGELLDEGAGDRDRRERARLSRR